MTVITYILMTPGRPQSILKNPGNTVVSQVDYYGNDIKDEIDERALIELVSRYECRRVRQKDTGFHVNEVAFYISLIDLKEFEYINLYVGEQNTCYLNSNWHYKEIINAEEMLSELEAMVEGS